MSNTIKIKNKTTAGIPIASQMETKELCLHETDNSLYYKRSSDGIVVKLNSAGTDSISHAKVMSILSIGF